MRQLQTLTLLPRTSIGSRSFQSFKTFKPFKWFDQLTMSGISTAALRSNRLDNELGITKSSRQVAWSDARRYDRLITSVAAVFSRPWQSPPCSFCPRRYESSHFSAGLSDPES